MSKFLQKHSLDPAMSVLIQQNNPNLDQQKLFKIHLYVSTEFDKFIEQHSFTQKNLQAFEHDLFSKINADLKKDGVILSKNSPRKITMDRHALPPKSGRNIRSKFDKDDYNDEGPRAKEFSKNCSLPIINPGRRDLQAHPGNGRFLKSKQLQGHSYSNSAR